MFINSHSTHSLRYGTISPTELVKKAKELGISSLALTDINNTSAMYEFIQECNKQSIKAIIGVDFRDQESQRYICLAKDWQAIGQLNQVISLLNQDKVCLDNALASLNNCYTIFPLNNIPCQLQDHHYIGITKDQLNFLYQEKYKNLIHKMVILHPVSIQDKNHLELHSILRAIDNNTLLSRINKNTIAQIQHCFIDPRELEKSFENYPIIVQNTQEIIDNCNLEFEFNQPRNKANFTHSKQSDMQLLSKLSYQGMHRIYGKNNPKAIERLQKELQVIDQLNFCGYFLITWDIVNYSTSRGFMHIGRGSGANSIVGYCLGITNVCPLELNLYFERFLNENRKSPPDFDIDWSWDQRDEILHYIFNKYGSNHVAFCGAISRFKYRSVIREIGKVYGLCKTELDELTHNPVQNHPKNAITKKVHLYGQMLEGFPNRRTMHPCGVIISQEPIYNYTALDYPPKGFAVAQFDMHTAVDIGFEKFDILSQRGIGHIKEATQLILENKNIQINIQDISLSKDHPKSNLALESGNTIGCFYIESPAMRGLLKRLKCDNYQTLVAASSIIRPGVAQSGMMQEYIFRHNNPDKFDYFHPVFEKELHQTYGIMVYQEDVIKIAMGYAGLPPSDGDLLRRAMSGKTRCKNAINQIKERFFDLCKQKGHPKQVSQEIYRQIESFAGYSFCKAHSASYAVESYQSLYLKVHYPLEFITAVINNQGGFYRTEVYIHEAKMAKATIHTPCINNSLITTTLKQKDLYLGFMFIQGLNQELAQRIITQRELNGPYKSLEDFVYRINIGMESLQNLIFVGSFKCFGKQKSELLITARLLLSKSTYPSQPTLLQQPIATYNFPKLQRSLLEDAFDELELLGFCVSCSVFDLLKTSYKGDVMADKLNDYHLKTVRMLGYLIAKKHVPTSAGTMYFGTWIDAQGNYFDTVHFPDSLKQYPFNTPGCYLLLAQVQIEYHHPTLRVIKMAKMPFITDPRFHDKDQENQKALNNFKTDLSNTNRAPYPKASEINLPRYSLKQK
ncbi:DNA polymerase III subunit alpha [Myroides sp. LJL119]